MNSKEKAREMQIFRRKSIEVQAIQLTSEIHKELTSLGKNENENPFYVKLDFAWDAITYWNWFTKQLYITTSDIEERINIGDWIIKELVDDQWQYSVLPHESFVRMYGPYNSEILMSGIEVQDRYQKQVETKKAVILRGILYQNKTINDLCKELDLTPGRLRQLLWQAMRDMNNKSIKPKD